MITLLPTPVQKYRLKDGVIYVKREDLCVPYPGPPFSKMRGLMRRLQKLKNEGKTIIGYTESSVSMAGWGIAWVCNKLNLQCIIFDPQYKKGNEPSLLRYHRKKWIENGAKIVPQKAGMVKVNYNISRKYMNKRFGSSGVLLPLGIPLTETIEETASEARKEKKRGIKDSSYKSVIVNVGSGTIAAGVARGFKTGTVVYGVMGRSGCKKHKMKSIQKKGRLINSNKTGMFGIDFRLIDPGWGYTEKSEAPCPFPCHPYYDLKAYQWMIENIKRLKKPILFWNIGHLPNS